MLPPYVHSTTFLLAIVGLIGCLGRFDYNAVLALGWIYLAEKHDSLAATPSFFVMVCGTSIVDVLTIIISSDQADKFTFLFMPLLEIAIKLAIIGFSLHYEWKRTKSSLQANSSD